MHFLFKRNVGTERCSYACDELMRVVLDIKAICNARHECVSLTIFLFFFFLFALIAFSSADRLTDSLPQIFFFSSRTSCYRRSSILSRDWVSLFKCIVIPVRSGLRIEKKQYEFLYSIIVKNAILCIYYVYI